jgi:hypothetical protein
MKTQTVADEYWSVAMSLCELSERLKFLSKISGVVPVDDIAQEMRNLSGRLVKEARSQEAIAHNERLVR